MSNYLIASFVKNTKKYFLDASKSTLYIKNLTAPWPWIPSIGQNEQPFTGDGDVYNWVKNSRVNPPLKKKYKQKERKLVWFPDSILCFY